MRQGPIPESIVSLNYTTHHFGARNDQGIIPELSRNYFGIISSGAVSATAAPDLPSTRAGSQDDVSFKHTPSKHFQRHGCTSLKF